MIGREKFKKAVLGRSIVGIEFQPDCSEREPYRNRFVGEDEVALLAFDLDDGTRIEFSGSGQIDVDCVFADIADRGNDD